MSKPNVRWISVDLAGVACWSRKPFVAHDYWVSRKELRVNLEGVHGKDYPVLYRVRLEKVK